MPLYILSASDLGTDPAHVDSALAGALERCRVWDALLLLDEADVFLESRSINNSRNELVSSKRHLCIIALAFVVELIIGSFPPTARILSRPHVPDDKSSQCNRRGFQGEN